MTGGFYSKEMTMCSKAFSTILNGLMRPAVAPIDISTSTESESQAVVPQPPLEPTLELVGRSGSGKTSFLWGLFHVLRMLSWVWPEYLCYVDAESRAQFLENLKAVQRRRLPDRAAGGGGSWYRLILKEMERWGERPLVLVDDHVGPFGELETANGRDVNWGAPLCWLLSLSDLDEVDAALVDVQLTDLVEARLRSARSIEAEPFKLIIALSKADRLPDLPDSLRRYLKKDPIAAVIEAARQLKAADVKPGDEALHFDGTAVARYMGEMWNVHEQIVHWLSRSRTGHLLARRASEHQLQVRFCLISATGSELVAGGGLAVPWSPRRVLDPLFWALELEGA
jgi:hypothetical protein